MGGRRQVGHLNLRRETKIQGNNRDRERRKKREKVTREEEN